MTREEAVARIAVLVGAAEESITEAETLAKEHGLDFDFSPAYGMGGTYYGVGDAYTGQGWYASSQSC